MYNIFNRRVEGTGHVIIGIQSIFCRAAINKCTGKYGRAQGFYTSPSLPRIWKYTVNIKPERWNSRQGTYFIEH